MVIESNGMKQLFKDFELIDKVQQDMANEAEKTMVQTRLISDAKFRKLFDDMEVLSEGIRRSGAKTTLEQKIQTLENSLVKEEQEAHEAHEAHNESLEPTIIKWYNRSSVRAIAASVVLVIASWVAFGPNPMTNQEIVATFFEPYQNTNSNTRGGNEEITSEDLTMKAFAAYDLEKYETAIPLFIEASEGNVDQSMNAFFLGNAYLAVGDGENAIVSFKFVLNEEKGLAGIAEYFLALSYLQAENAEQAKISLINVRDHAEKFYSDKAMQILDKLE